jgi:hypothetical protein
MKKIFLAALLVLISLLLIINTVDANPIPYPPLPNTDLPSLTVDIPTNPSPLYDNRTASMKITIIQPDVWLSYHMGFIPYVGTWSGNVYIDGVMKLGLPSTQVKVNNYNISFTGYPSTLLRINGYDRSFTGSFTGDTVQHKLTIQLFCETFSEISGRVRTYESNITQDITFAIDSNSQAVSFLETPVRIDRGIYPTASPSSSATPTITSIVILATSVIAVIAVASVLLVYFKRREPKPISSQKCKAS